MVADMLADYLPGQTRQLATHNKNIITYLKTTEAIF